MPKEKVHTAIFTAYDEETPFDPAQPEKALLKALLLNALSDLKKTGELKRQATEFFLSSEENHVCSFLSICSHLNIDPKKILYTTGLLKSPSQR